MKKILLLLSVCLVLVFTACTNDSPMGVMPTLIISTPESTDPIETTSGTLTPDVSDFHDATPTHVATEKAESATNVPTDIPETKEPTQKPVTEKPTLETTQKPATEKPTLEPTQKPVTEKPTLETTQKPATEKPTLEPTQKPITEKPTLEPTQKPITEKPVKTATPEPTEIPVATATVLPTQIPSLQHMCKFGEWVVIMEPTTEFTGIKERVCSICEGKETEEIPVKQLSDDEKLAEACKVAEGIASSIPLIGTDIDRITEAAQIINNYCMSSDFTFEGTDHSTAYGVLVKGEYSSAGATEALGLVLKYMGFKWERADGGNASYHQWCVVKMDGQEGYADALTGTAGYGKHP